ncbi:MAG TPA: UTP--glucose-1-phosphate uridylyltransferase [Planctomycetota bacterium]|nr:UTP--glucose-1-phosphate uridylyltransferase [Planctomycetota bacterium]
MKVDRGLRARLANAGQEFLAEHVEALEAGKQEVLLPQIEALDLEALAGLRRGEGLAAPPTDPWSTMPHLPDAERGPRTEAAVRGRMELAGGKVAFAMIAGGQASRLRWDGPKGTFPIGPRTERSLFQLLVEHLVRATRDFGAVPPLAVTTSPTTDAAIRAFFELNDCFGFDRSVLTFACQSSLPVLDDEKKLVLAAPDRLFLSPDGHGGAIQSLETKGVLKAWEQQGIATVCTFQVDNPLLRVVDPDFIGRIWTEGTPAATKVVLKRTPEQKLGLVVRRKGRPSVVEYTEAPADRAGARDPDGALTYRLGSIAAHAFRLDFLRRALAAGLPLHPARKEIPVVDAVGEPQRVQGTKYERFLFDVFPHARDATVVEVLPEREYAPVKNVEGEDSPDTSRMALEAEYRRWYREAGREPPEGIVELSPLDALGPEDLRPSNPRGGV